MLQNINGAMQRMDMYHIFAQTQQTEVYTDSDLIFTTGSGHSRVNK